jgi:hypothetical protein
LQDDYFFEPDYDNDCKFYGKHHNVDHSIDSEFNSSKWNGSFRTTADSARDASRNPFDAFNQLDGGNHTMSARITDA